MKSERMLEGWLDEHLHEIEEAQAFSVQDIPDEPGKLGQHLSIATGLYPRIGFLLADAESFVLKAHAVATIESRKLYPDLSAEERKIMAKADSTYVQVVRLRDNLQVIVTALKNKAFALMNTRNNTHDPAMAAS